MTRYVTRYMVDGVRHERSSDGTHMHIAGVYVGDDYYPRQQVVRSINLQNEWVAIIGDMVSPIDVVSNCPYRGCQVAPYVHSASPMPGTDSLDLLPVRREAS